MNKKRSFFKNPRTWGLVGFLFLLIALPLVIIVSQLRQETRQRAEVGPSANQSWVCAVPFPDGSRHCMVVLTENPTCSAGATNITQYQNTWTFENYGPLEWKITINLESYVCTQPSDYTKKDQGDNGCYGHPQIHSYTITLPAGLYSKSPPFTTPVRKVSDYSTLKTCGDYQNDVSFDIQTSSGLYKQHWPRFATYYQYGRCTTSQPTCPAETPTPTSSPTPTGPASPTPTVTPSPSPTPACPVPSPVTNVKISCPSCSQ